MYILGGMLFSFEVLVKNFDEEDKLYQILKQIDCKEIEKLNGCYIGPGRKRYDRVALFRALALKKLIGLPNTKSLVRCLCYSPLLAHWCGFDPMKNTPSESVFSRFEKDLNELNLQKALSDLCNDLSSQVLAIVGSNGEIAIDSTDISAVERPKKENETGASFGHRTASAGETEMFYGYKLHLAAVNP